MNRPTLLPPFLIIGLAIFSMFFGAGNVIYPMDLGIDSPSIWAWLGFLLTAIGAPLLGLYALMLSKGDLFKLFEDIGLKGSSLWIGILILALGPLGATPRCVLLSYQAIKAIFPAMPLSLYSLALCLILYFISLKRLSAFSILGKWLSPVLLGLLLWIAFLNLKDTGAPVESQVGLIEGLLEGYQTMDLLAALLFGVTIWSVVKQFAPSFQHAKHLYFKASLIGAGMLCFVYLCLGLAASTHSIQLAQLSKDMYLNALAIDTLGGIGGHMACLVICLTCITTIVALMMTCSENALRIAHKVSNKNPSYAKTLFWMFAFTLLSTNLGFERVSQVISFLVTITYPVYIMIVVCFILSKQFNLRYVNRLTYVTLFSAVGIQGYLSLGHITGV